MTHYFGQDQSASSSGLALVGDGPLSKRALHTRTNCSTSRPCHAGEKVVSSLTRCSNITGWSNLSRPAGEKEFASRTWCFRPLLLLIPVQLTKIQLQYTTRGHDHEPIFVDDIRVNGFYRKLQDRHRTCFRCKKFVTISPKKIDRLAGNYNQITRCIQNPIRCPLWRHIWS